MICSCLPLLLLLAAPLVDDDEIVARGGSIELTRAEFADWLVERVGYLHVTDFIDEALILRAAEDVGRAPSDETVASESAKLRAQTIEQYFRGDEQRYLEDLSRKGVDPDSHDRRRLAETRFNLCLFALAADERRIDEAQLRTRYKDLYGELGERVTLDVLFYNAYHGLEPGADRPDLERLQSAANERAQEGAQGLANGLALGELLAGTDPTPSEFVTDGRIERYRTRMLGPEVDRAVQSLDRPGDMTPIIAVYNGSYVLRLVGRQSVSFEQARPELEQMLQDAPPTSNELSAARQKVQDAADKEVFVR